MGRNGKTRREREETGVHDGSVPGRFSEILSPWPRGRAGDPVLRPFFRPNALNPDLGEIAGKSRLLCTGCG